MITAIDTNVLLDILVPDPAFLEYSLNTLGKVTEQGPIVICETVYAELACHYPLRRSLDSFLANTKVTLLASSLETLHLAGQLFKRRNRSIKGPKRILADFFVGAHALKQADRLLTRDRGFYRSEFRDLTVLNPSP